MTLSITSLDLLGVLDLTETFIFPFINSAHLFFIDGRQDPAIFFFISIYFLRLDILDFIDMNHVYVKYET